MLQYFLFLLLLLCEVILMLIDFQPTFSQVEFFIATFYPPFFELVEKSGLPPPSMLNHHQLKKWSEVLHAAFKFAHDELSQSFNLSPLPSIHYEKLFNRFSAYISPVKLKVFPPLDVKILANSPMVRRVYSV